MAAFKETVLELLGPTPEQCSLDPTIESSKDLGDITRLKISYMVEPNDRVPAFLFIPKTARGRTPAILAHHQHAGQFDIGKSEVAGLAGDPDQAYAVELARRNYIVLAPDAICFEERASDEPMLKGRYHELFEFTKRITEGSSLQAKMFGDMQRGLDYLMTLPVVDQDRLGCIGHSLGGQQALILAALDERVKVGVSSCGFSSYRAVFDGDHKRTQNMGFYIPKLREHGDFGDILGEVSPRPFLALSKEDDPVFPIDGVRDSVARARIAYDRDHASDRLVSTTYPGVHQFSPGMRADAYNFFYRYL
jgi:dienelactone hydrolase